MILAPIVKYNRYLLSRNLHYYIDPGGHAVVRASISPPQQRVIMKSLTSYYHRLPRRLHRCHPRFSMHPYLKTSSTPLIPLCLS